MKYLCIILILLVLSSCKQNKKKLDDSNLISIENKSTEKTKTITDTIVNKNSTNKIENKEIIHFKIDDDKYHSVNVTFSDYDAENFEFKQKGNILYIYNLLYENISDRFFEFQLDDNELLNIKYKIYISFIPIQTTLDSYPAEPLKYSFNLNSNYINVDENSFFLPLFNTSDQDNSFANLFNKETNDDFIQFIESKHFDNIKNLSLKKQSKIFRSVLTTKQYELCCPEYIKQANGFFNKNKDSIKSLRDLNIDLRPSIIKLKIIFTLKDSSHFSKTIINKYKP